MTAQLSVRLAKRELEFIELRYGQVKSLKEVAHEMHISMSTAKAYSAAIHAKLDSDGSGFDQTGRTIRTVKRLIEHGYIGTEVLA